MVQPVVEIVKSARHSSSTGVLARERHTCSQKSWLSVWSRILPAGPSSASSGPHHAPPTCMRCSPVSASSSSGCLTRTTRSHPTSRSSGCTLTSRSPSGPPPSIRSRSSSTRWTSSTTPTPGAGSTGYPSRGSRRTSSSSCRRCLTTLASSSACRPCRTNWARATHAQQATAAATASKRPSRSPKPSRTFCISKAGNS
eukprot:04676_3